MKICSAFSLIFVSFLSLSCLKKEKFDKISIEDYSPSLAFPLINAEMNLKDIAENIDKSETNVTEDNSGLYIFYYRDTTASETAESYIKIPDQNYSKSFQASLAEQAQLTLAGTVEKSFDDAYAMSFPNGGNISTINFKAGDLTITIDNEFESTDLQLNLDIHSLKNKHTGLSYSRTINNPGQGYSLHIPLQDYIIELDDNNLSYGGEVVFSGGTVSSDESISFEFEMAGMKFRKMIGNIGSFTAPPIKGDVGIEIFEDADYGNIYLSEASFKTKIMNSFGIPVKIDIQQLDAIADYGQVVSFTSTETDQPISLPIPSNSTAPPTYHTIEINKDNSNIIDAINPAPYKIEYIVQPTVGEGGNKDNFVLDTSRVKLFTEARIPMSGWISELGLEDTIPDISLPDPEMIESVSMKMRIENRLPVNVNFQLYFLDSLNTVLDSLLPESEKNLIVSGPVNSNGEVSSAHVEYTEIHIDLPRYKKIADADRVILKGDLETPGHPDKEVKFFSHSGMKVQISFIANARVNLNE